MIIIINIGVLCYLVNRFEACFFYFKRKISKHYALITISFLFKSHINRRTQYEKPETYHRRKNSQGSKSVTQDFTDKYVSILLYNLKQLVNQLVFLSFICKIMKK